MCAQAAKSEKGGDFERLRAHLRQNCVEAYHRKAAQVEALEPGLMLVRFSSFLPPSSQLQSFVARLEELQPGLILAAYLAVLF